ncbi:MAG: ATP-dependent helicase [Candidatus Woesearchaeota archaeon]
MIVYDNEPKNDAEILEILEDEIKDWFLHKYKTFTPPQRYSILNIHNKNNVLISSPTGSGKTLSAFLAILNELFKLSKENRLEDKIYAIYVSPLKALNNDIKRNLLEPLQEIENLSGIIHGIRIAVRNSDTTSNEKSKMLRKPPHILITTPESLTLSLTSPRFKEKLIAAEWVIVDEIHALAENKRGALLSLSIERLDYLKKKSLVRIGLSATVSPLEEVAKYLVGKGSCKIIDVQAIKEIEMKIITPTNDLINTPFEKIHHDMYKIIHELIQTHKTTLIFTNTRSATERVVYYLKEKFNYSDLEIGAHHSSLSKEIRQDIEERMKSGKLKVIVSSTSLELGIDIGSIDLVILLSSPKSIARALQRIGRSGHKLHEKSKGIFISLDNDDLIECCILKRCAEKRKIDNIKIPKNPLDVLAQHIVSMAYEEISVEDAYKVIRRSYNFDSLSKEDFEEMLRFLSGFYSDLEERNVYGKIKIENGKILPRKGSRMIFLLNSGVIPDTSDVVVLLKNKPIGFIDELFLERLNKNDIFVLGGKTYRFLKSSGMACFVENADGLTPTVPSWFSESLPLSYDLALEILLFRKKMDEWLDKFNQKEIIEKIRKELNVSEEISKIIFDYFYEQKKYIGIPNYDKMIIEIYRDNDTKIIFHTLFGRRVNDVLSRAAADILSQMTSSDILININDNAFSLSLPESISKEDVYFLYQELLNYDLNRLEQIIENTELFFRRFRHVATRSFLVLKNYKGKKRSVNKQQLSAKQIYNLIKTINHNFILIKETRREILEEHMDLTNAKNALQLMKKMNFEIVKVKYPSPFALNLILDSYSDLLKAETKHEFLKKMHHLILNQISKKI